MTTALPDFPMTTHPDMLPVRFEAPPVNPAPGGLYSSVFWTEVGTDEASRHLTGVEVRGANFPGDQVGVWDAPWCGVPALDGDRKQGERGGILDPFDPLVVDMADDRSSHDFAEPAFKRAARNIDSPCNVTDSDLVVALVGNESQRGGHHIVLDGQGVG